MIAIGFVYLLFCSCFVIVNSQSTVDETSGECSNDEYMYLLQTVERTYGATQQLFDRHEQLLKQVSAQLMTNTCSQSNTTENGEYEKGGSTQQLLMEVRRSCGDVTGSGEHQNAQQPLIQT